MSPDPGAASSLWTAAGWTMLHLLWFGAAVGSVAALLRRLLRRARAEIRHGVALACLLALAAAPLIILSLIYQPGPATPAVVAPARRLAAPADRAPIDLAPPLAAARRRSDVGAPATMPRDAVASRFERLVAYLPGVWLSGSLMTLCLLATGLAGVERLRQSSLTLESGAIARRSRVLAESLGIAWRVGVAVCDQIAAPVLIGVVRPLILLPPAALGGWSVEQVEMALLHELAHLRRRDNLVNLLQRLVESVLFFHPVTWWLSAWIRLERELCCDRIVVEHTGRPYAYAQLLASLAGSGPPSRIPAPGMAERPLMTRIRRILDMEDRSMKMTLLEGLGLLAAAIVGMAITLGARAEPPPPGPDEADRQALDRLAESILTLPDDGGDGYSKGQALLSIARARLKLGDRQKAIATLRHLDDLAEHLHLEPGAENGPGAWEFFATLTESVEIRQDAGDIDGARATLDRASRFVEGFDAAEARAAVGRAEEDLKAAIGKKDDGPRVVSDEASADLIGASFELIDRYIALGDMVEARTRIRRALETIGPIQGPLETAMVGALGGYLVKAGDPDGGHDRIEQARRATLELPDPETRAFALPHLALTLAEAGDLDKALALVGEMTPRTQQAALGRILAGLTTDDHRVAWLDPAGIKITIGDQSLTPKDSVAARTVLPKIAAAARAAGNAKVQARTLAIVSHLQARAGDFAGALATAESIPVLKRSDFPGRSDGFYDAVKPATFAIVAGLQAEAGDEAAGAATFARSEALARAVEAEDQKLIAQIVIAQKHASCGRHAAAKAVVTEAIPLALRQPEPRRSRVLTMLAEAQIKAGDGDGALRTIDAIREYPGLEKVRALGVLSRWHEGAGDAATSEKLVRRAIQCLKARAPATPLPGEELAVNAFARDTFIDFDLELNPGLLNFHRDSVLQGYRTRVGDVEAAVREAKALPPARRDAALARIAGSLAHRGDLAGAKALADSIESPDARLRAFAALAATIPERQTRK